MKKILPKFCNRHELLNRRRTEFSQKQTKALQIFSCLIQYSP